MSRLVFSRFANYLDEIAKHGSIRKAAEALNISASAIDKQLIYAERELDVDLFERLPRGLRLTSAGEMLLLAIRNWRREFARVQNDIDELKGLRRGNVKIAVAQEAADFLPGVLAGFMRDQPGIVNHVAIVESDRVRQMVVDGAADFGLTFSPQPLPGVMVARSVPFRVRALVPAHGDFAGREAISLRELFDCPVVMPDINVHLRDVADILAARIGAQPRTVLTTNNLDFMKAMVREGVGLGLLTTADRLDRPAAEGLAYLEIADEGVPGFRLSLISSSDRRLSVAALFQRRRFELCMDGMEAAPT